MMKKALLAAAFAATVFTGVNTSTHADGHDWKVIPVEIYACSYNEGKGPADHAEGNDRFNDWADEQGVDDYAGWVLTPFYFAPGANSGFDFLWLGASKDPVGMAKAQEAWLGATEMLDYTNSLWTCDSHGGMASINHKPGDTPKDGVISMSDCSYREGATFDNLNAAMADYAKMMEEAGSTSTIFHWYPVYGGGGDGYDFKQVVSFSSLVEQAKDLDRITNGKMFVERNRLLQHMTDCDSRRVYMAESVRYVELR